MSVGQGVFDYRGGDLQDRSGSITTLNTSQQVCPANPARNYLLIQNISDTDMWVNFGSPAVTDAPSVKIVANTGSLIMDDWVTRLAVNIICAAAGKKFVVKEA